MKETEAIEHITSQNERWDTLAWRYYGDPHAYGRIMDANPAFDLSPVLPSGRMILIPLLTEAETLQTLSTEDLPPWKR